MSTVSYQSFKDSDLLLFYYRFVRMDRRAMGEMVDAYKAEAARCGDANLSQAVLVLEDLLLDFSTRGNEVTDSRFHLESAESASWKDLDAFVAKLSTIMHFRVRFSTDGGRDAVASMETLVDTTSSVEELYLITYFLCQAAQQTSVKKAVPAARKLLDAATKRFGRKHWLSAYSLLFLSYANLGEGKTNKGVQLLKDCYGELQALEGKDSPILLGVVDSLLSLDNEGTSAERLLPYARDGYRIQSLVEDLPASLRIRFFVPLAHILAQKGMASEFETVMKDFEERCSALSGLEKANILFGLAQAGYYKGEYNKALEWAMESYKIMTENLKALEIGSLLHLPQLIANVYVMTERISELPAFLAGFIRFINERSSCAEDTIILFTKACTSLPFPVLPLLAKENFGRGPLRFQVLMYCATGLTQTPEGRAEAMELYREAHEAAIRAALNTYYTSEPLAGLAALLKDNGEDGAAIRTLDKALSFVDDETSEQWAKLQESKAEALRNLDRTEEAEELFNKVLEIYRKDGSKQLELAFTLQNLAHIYSITDRHPQSLTYYRDALAIFMEVAGPEDEHTIDTTRNLGMALSNNGHFKEALATVQRAIFMREKAEGRNTSGQEYCVMADIHLAMGNIAKAESCARKALKMDNEMGFYDSLMNDLDLLCDIAHMRGDNAELANWQSMRASYLSMLQVAKEIPLHD